MRGRDTTNRRNVLALGAGLVSAGLSGYVRRGGSRSEELEQGRQRTSFAGLSHRAIGGAELRKTDEGLVVQLTEDNRRGGERVVMDGVEGFSTRWTEFEEGSAADGRGLQISANGRVSRRDGEKTERMWLGGLRVLGRGQGVGVVANYEPLDSEAQLLVVLSEGERVAVVEEHEGAFKALAPRLPDGCGKLPPDFPPQPPACYIINWPRPVPIGVPGVGFTEGDELRVLAADSPFEIESLEQFDVRLRGLQSMTVLSESVRYG